MRQILFNYAGCDFHSLFNYILEYPPEGYKFVFPKKTVKRQSQFIGKARAISSLKNNSVGGFLRCQLRWYTGDIFEKTLIDADLIFSPHKLVYSKKKPWIIMIEYIGDLCPIIYDVKNLWLYRSFIERVLASKCCKKIVPYLNTEKMALCKNLKCAKFKDKIEVVNLAVPPKNFQKEYCEDKVSLLFLGTVHGSNILKSFQERGGSIVLEAFKILDKQFSNLELIIRSSIPSDARSKYSQILIKKNVRIFDQILSREAWEQVMKNVDIFLFPGHITPALTILDAMSYELPVVATNWRGNFEMVKDGETGLLIAAPFGLNPLLLTRELVETISANGPDIHVAKDLVEKTSRLIEDEKLRRRMGVAGRREIETGKFSIKKRNEKLKKIFDEALDS